MAIHVRNWVGTYVAVEVLITLCSVVQWNLSAVDTAVGEGN